MKERAPSFLDHLESHSVHLVAVVVPLSVLILGIDFATGPRVRFPILFVLPVWLAGRCGHRCLVYGLSAILPVVRFGFTFYWLNPFSVMESTINGLIRLVVLAFLGHLTLVAAARARELQQRVRALETILPICSHCRKIRNADEQWVSLEKYVTAKLEAKLSHGICPECIRIHFPQQYDRTTR